VPDGSLASISRFWDSGPKEMLFFSITLGSTLPSARGFPPTWLVQARTGDLGAAAGAAITCA
jgi:hypothetical protein